MATHYVVLTKEIDAPVVTERLNASVSSYHKSGIRNVVYFVAPNTSIDTIKERTDIYVIPDEPSTVFCPLWRNNAIYYPHMRELVDGPSKVVFIADIHFDPSMYPQISDYISYIFHIRNYENKKFTTFDSEKEDIVAVIDSIAYEKCQDVVIPFLDPAVIEEGIDHYRIYEAARYYKKGKGKTLYPVPGWAFQPGTRWLTSLFDADETLVSRFTRMKPSDKPSSPSGYVTYQQTIIPIDNYQEIVSNEAFRIKIAHATKTKLLEIGAIPGDE